MASTRRVRSPHVHYEIAAYGSLRSHAEQMGHERAAAVLQETLDEEVATHQKFATQQFKIAAKRAAMVLARWITAAQVPVPRG